jgi:uncharacterized membrane protein YvbJ
VWAESVRLKCTKCGAEIPEVSRFCLSCGMEVPPPKQAFVQPKDDSETNFASIVMFMFAFMIFFFALVPIFLGLWIGAVIMASIGLVLVIIGYLMIRSNKKQVEKAREEAMVKIKCQYCGKLNDQDATRCDSCGATL